MTAVTNAMHEPTTTTTRAAEDNPRAMVPLGFQRGSTPGVQARFWTALGVAGGLLAVSIIGAVVIKIPYVTFEPGNARPVQPVIEIRAVPTYPSEGIFLFTTVSIDDEVSLFEALGGWLDPDIDVFPAERIFGDRTSAENQQINQQLMDDSKVVAVVVALSRLGYELHPTGTGATVLEVVPDTPAATALQPGDTIVGVDGAPIRLREELFDALSARAPGSAIALGVENVDRVARTVDVTLASRPDDPAAAFLGVNTFTRNFDPGLPFPVLIDSGEVGGPSAGLAFALSVIDVLTPGELTGGELVAITGTIGADGTVGNVGGVAQKAAAAADEGARVFLVPPEEFDEALAHNHGMTIVAVATLDEALAALAELGGDPLPATPTAG